MGDVVGPMVLVAKWCFSFDRGRTVFWTCWGFSVSVASFCARGRTRIASLPCIQADVSFLHRTLAAALIGGLSDTIVYGRPFESFWNYFQFNMVTGLAPLKHGTGSILVYAAWFDSSFLGLYPMASCLFLQLGSGSYALCKSIKSGPVCLSSIF